MAVDDRLNRIERLSRWPLLILALLFVPAVFVEYLGAFAAETRRAAAVVEYAIHGLFALEFLARLLSVSDKADYVRRNWFDLGTVVLPPLRLLRSYREKIHRELA